ncbi:MAG: serine hydrolase domain-containing protein [Nitrospirota bacterium]|nr:serine hydrolase domain-containing protein [Nitrospirota bacterium]
MPYFNTKKIVFYLSALTLVACTGLPKAPENPELGDYTYMKKYMTAFIKSEMKAANITGLSIAVVDDQQIIWSKGFGYADKENDIPATAQTRYRAGSVSKLFTALAAMQLSEQGKLDIDQALVNYLPEFKIKSRFVSSQDITPRTLMTHQSGLPTNYNNDRWAIQPASSSDLARQLQHEYLAYPPRTISSYSNLGFTLLGQTVAKISHQSFGNYIMQNLLSPMDMFDSDFTGHLTGKMAAVGYRAGKAITELPFGEDPAGALNSNVVDLSRFIMMVNAQGRSSNKQIIKPETLARMFVPQNEDIALDFGMRMGLAWFFNDDYLGSDEIVVGHDGGTIAHSALLKVSPTAKLGIVLLSNSSEASGRLDAIGKKAMRLAYTAKTGVIPITRPITPKMAVLGPKDITGHYATSMLGLVTIVNQSGKLKARTMGHTFDLKLKKDGYYYMAYHLLGFIPVPLHGLEEIGLQPVRVNGRQLLAGKIDARIILVGEKIEAFEVPQSWRARMGHYEVIVGAELPQALGLSTSLELKMRDGFLVSVSSEYGDQMARPLRAMNETEAIVMGLGTGLGQTIYVDEIDGNEVLKSSGTILKRATRK